MNKSASEITLANGASLLKQAGIENPWREARLLFAHHHGVEVASLIGFPEKIIPDQTGFMNLIQRRIAGEPFSKIKGYREFYGLNFKISQAVLDPRADTEILIETAIKLYPKEWAGMMLDIGIGAGTLLLTLLDHFKQAKGVGIDISEAALEIAQANAVSLGLSDRVDLLCANWFPAEGKFDLILANPPYIKTTDIEGLDQGVKAYDPLLALDGGIDGLDAYRHIANRLSDYTKRGSHILFEIGQGQEQEIIQIMQEKGFIFIASFKDLGGIIRGLLFKNP